PGDRLALPRRLRPGRIANAARQRSDGQSNRSQHDDLLLGADAGQSLAGADRRSGPRLRNWGGVLGLVIPWGDDRLRLRKITNTGAARASRLASVLAGHLRIDAGGKLARQRRDGGAALMENDQGQMPKSQRMNKHQ